MTDEPINQRAQQVLKTLVEQYIKAGQPVGSKALATRTKLDLSPASIRHVLADLEAQGYLQAPHTSAGRIPTVKGYRLFINSLLQMQTLNEDVIASCQQRLDPDLDQKSLLQTATGMLSQMTKFAGIVTIASPQQSKLRQVEFLSLSQSRVLVVLVFGEKEGKSVV